jgi:hypothetical protein
MIWGAIAKNAPELPAFLESQFLRRSARERKEQENSKKQPDRPALLPELSIRRASPTGPFSRLPR